MVATHPFAHPCPPADPGFAATPVDELLESQEDLIARIRLCFGIDRDSFEREVMPLLRGYAACVHLLPATPDNYFNRPGGLLRLGLEVGFFSLQGTDAHIFSGGSSITARRQLEPRWRQATFIAGLCCELHRLLSHLIVMATDGDHWPAYLSPLAGWLQQRNAERYFIRWRPHAVEARGLGLFALPHVVPRAVLQYLNEDNSVIVPHLMASVGGVSLHADRNVLESLVRRSLALVIDRDLQANADRYCAPQRGSHVERHLMEAIRRLAADDLTWVANSEKSRVWFGREGLFLVWPQAAKDMLALLEADQLPGVPKSPETILELLLASGIAQGRDANHPTWAIQPPGIKTTLDAAKLSSAAILYPAIEQTPKALDVDLVPRASEPAVPPAEAPQFAAPATPRGSQLSLIESAELPGEQPVEDDGPAAAAATTPMQEARPASPRRRAFTLKAPLRLNPAVRDALASVVASLEGVGARPTCGAQRSCPALRRCRC